MQRDELAGFAVLPPFKIRLVFPASCRLAEPENPPLGGLELFAFNAR